MALVLKSLAALCLLTTAGAPIEPRAAPAQPLIPLVSCDSVAGSAFRVGPHVLLSVAHVTSNPGCKIDGEPIHVVYSAKRPGDFSILSDDRASNFIKVDCNGFVEGRRYLVVGHARAQDRLTVVEVVATGYTQGGLALLVGTFTAQPGQSGGPVLDAETLEVVGTVNTAAWEAGITGSTELRGTSVCTHA